MTQPASSRASVRVLIVEDHVLFAESLELVLSVEGYDVRRIAVPTTTQTPSAVAAAIVRQRPRIVLLDLDLGGFGDGVRLIDPLARAGANVVVVTASTDRARWGEAVRAGARKVLAKSGPLNDIRATVRRISQGLTVMDREEREELVAIYAQHRAKHHELRGRIDDLTARERQVLGHLVYGRTVREIAHHGVVSEATVRTQVKSILSKLSVSSQIAAVGVAHQLGWQPPDL